MADIGLPLKYRPNFFEEVVGQDIPVKYCSELIRRGQQGKNLIIYGPWGSGKTTTARIYGRALNCEAPQPSGSPCGVCKNCQMLSSDGTGFPDYVEFDGASQGSKENIKDVIQDAKAPPLFGKWRIIVVDEAQGVSKQGFDALLKLIEESPPHLVFMFLTTEYEKIRPAIRSRCAKLEVKMLENGLARAHLEKICKLENFTYEPRALDTIVHMSKGHPRDLLKNLEQASIYGDITIDQVKTIFSLDYVECLLNYLKAVLAKDFKAQWAAIDTWSETPDRKLVAIQEFFLYLYLKGVMQLPEIAVNPALDLLPESDRKNFLLAFRARCDESGQQPDDIWRAMIKFWGEQPAPQSDVILYYHLLHFHHLVNTNNFNNSRLPTAVVNRNTKGVPLKKDREGRTFTSNMQQTVTQQAPKLKPTVPPNTPEAAPKPIDKVFPHHLPQMGFGKPQSIEEISLD